MVRQLRQMSSDRVGIVVYPPRIAWGLRRLVIRKWMLRVGPVAFRVSFLSGPACVGWLACNLAMPSVGVLVRKSSCLRSVFVAWPSPFRFAMRVTAFAVGRRGILCLFGPGSVGATRHLVVVA